MTREARGNGTGSRPLWWVALPIVWACLVCCALCPAAEPQPELALRFDPYLSIESGSTLTHTAVDGVARLESWAFRPLAGRPGGRAARVTWAVLFDLPVAWWFAVLEHEAFGHAGRAREFGSTGGAHMGFPWRDRSSYATFDTDKLSNEEELRVFAGGSESNGWTATLLERELVAGRSFRPLELFFLASNRFVTSDYVLRTTPDPVSDPAGFFAEFHGGGDVANYLGRLSVELVGDPGITPEGSSPLVVSEFRRLDRQATWNALDPGAWIALVSAAVQVWKGGAGEPVPLPRIRGRRFLPILSAEWLPDGGVASLELVFGAPELSRKADPARWFSFVVRHGPGQRGALTAVGAATERLASTATVRVGGEIELWSYPGHAVGGGFRLSLRRVAGKLQGFVLTVGAKSSGHWPGRPANTGPFLSVGYLLIGSET